MISFRQFKALNVSVLSRETQAMRLAANVMVRTFTGSFVILQLVSKIPVSMENEHSQQRS